MSEPRGHRAGRLSLAGAFAGAALRYWLTVFPRVSSELRHWRRSAKRIADPGLRRLALESLAKRGNMEGAAAFATFVPWRARGSVIRALVAFQAIYNYADLLAEQPSEDPVGNARDVHQALLMALDPSGESSMHNSHLARRARRSRLSCRDDRRMRDRLVAASFLRHGGRHGMPSRRADRGLSESQPRPAGRAPILGRKPGYGERRLRLVGGSRGRRLLAVGARAARRCSVT